MHQLKCISNEDMTLKNNFITLVMDIIRGYLWITTIILVGCVVFIGLVFNINWMYLILLQLYTLSPTHNMEDIYLRKQHSHKLSGDSILVN